MSKKNFKKLLQAKRKEFVKWAKDTNYYSKVHIVDPLEIEYE